VSPSTDGQNGLETILGRAIPRRPRRVRHVPTVPGYMFVARHRSSAITETTDGEDQGDPVAGNEISQSIPYSAENHGSARELHLSVRVDRVMAVALDAMATDAEGEGLVDHAGRSSPTRPTDAA
jgi:hypothetical protein